MATEKLLTLSTLTYYDEKIKAYIGTEDAKSFKTALYDADTRTVKLFKAESPAEGDTPDFSFVIPEQDVSSFLEKIVGGTEDNVVTVGIDGTVKDSGIASADIATKSEVEAVDVKVGTLTDLTTTDKTDVVTAINEVKSDVGEAETNLAVTINTSATTEGYLKSYTIKQGESTIGVIDIPKDLVVTSGEVVANPEGQAEGTYIKLTIANQEAPIYINVKTLVDVYTAQQSATQIQLVISDTNEISATIVAGSVGTTEIADKAVTLAKLAEDAVAAFDAYGAAETALTNAKAYTDELANGAVATNTAAIAALNDETTGVVATSKSYTDEAIKAAVTDNLVTTSDIDSLF